MRSREQRFGASVVGVVGPSSGAQRRQRRGEDGAACLGRSDAARHRAKTSVYGALRANPAMIIRISGRGVHAARSRRLPRRLPRLAIPRAAPHRPQGAAAHTRATYKRPAHGTKPQLRAIIQLGDHLRSSTEPRKSPQPARPPARHPEDSCRSSSAGHHARRSAASREDLPHRPPAPRR